MKNNNFPSNYAYIHGFNSDKNSRSFKEINALLGNVADLHYSYMQNAESALYEIENKLVSACAPNKNLTLIGSSLGGFFALYLARKHKLPCIAFNPVTRPHEQLAPFVGKNYNFYTNQEWDFSREILMSYQKLPLSTEMAYTPKIILGTNDTVIDPSVTLNFWFKHAKILLTAEEHSISRYSRFLALFQDS